MLPFFGSSWHLSLMSALSPYSSVSLILMCSCSKAGMGEVKNLGGGGGEKHTHGLIGRNKTAYFHLKPTPYKVMLN